MILPKIILVSWYMLALGINLARHGQYKVDERYNFWLSLLSVAIVFGLLWWGGFFS